MKKTTISIITVLAISFITGLFIYNKSTKKIEVQPSKVIAVEDECTQNAELQEHNAMVASSTEEKISPNTDILEKVYYKQCGHTLESKRKVSSQYVNYNKQEIQEIYKEWEVQEFNKDIIVLYKEVEEFCNEHYVLRIVNGYIGIYLLDKDEKETLIKITDIATKYLTDTDLVNMENGIKIYTKQELNKIIEDFE